MAVILGSLGPLVNSGHVFADAKSSTVGTEKLLQVASQKVAPQQLKADDSDIDTWMPSKDVQMDVLIYLIDTGALPKGSTVNDITKELLASVDSSRLLTIAVDTYVNGKIIPNLTEGLQYLNKAININLTIIDKNEDKLLDMDWKQLHENVDTWQIKIASPEKISHPQLMEKIKEANLPAKEDGALGHSVTYLQGEYKSVNLVLTPTYFKQIDIKGQDFFPSVKLDDSDFWNEFNENDYINDSLHSSLLTTKNNTVLSDTLYTFKEDPNGGYLGEPVDILINRLAMTEIQKDPDKFYASFVKKMIQYDGKHQKVELNNEIYANFTN